MVSTQQFRAIKIKPEVKPAKQRVRKIRANLTVTFVYDPAPEYNDYTAFFNQFPNTIGCGNTKQEALSDLVKELSKAMNERPKLCYDDDMIYTERKYVCEMTIRPM